MEKRIDKATERALEAYPIVTSQYSDNCKEYDSNESDRLTFIEGYHQAEKDMELTWEDIVDIDKLLIDLGMMFPIKSTPDYYKEVLKRFKAMKDGKEDQV